MAPREQYARAPYPFAVSWRNARDDREPPAMCAADRIPIRDENGATVAEGYAFDAPNTAALLQFLDTLARDVTVHWARVQRGPERVQAVWIEVHGPAKKGAEDGG